MRVKVMTMNMGMNIMMIPHMYTMTHLFVGQASRPAHRHSVYVIMTMNMDINIMMIPRMYKMTYLVVGRASRPARQHSVYAMTQLFIGQADRHASPPRNIRIIPLIQFLD